MGLIEKLVRRAVRHSETGRIVTWMTTKEFENVNNFDALRDILAKHNIKTVEIRDGEAETKVYDCERKIG